MLKDSRKSDRHRGRSLVGVLALLTFSCASAVPVGLPTPEDAADAQPPALVQVGRALFSDKRLSIDGTVSCANCHVPKRNFTDAYPTAHGIRSQVLTRRTPSLLNVRYATSLFWDGRSPDLESQAPLPLLSMAEHGLPNEESVAGIVRGDSGYATAFEHLFGIDKEAISLREIGAAVAAYERTLLAGDSPFDRYLYGGDRQAISRSAERGLTLFRGRAQCATCHTIGPNSALLSDGEFHPSPVRLTDSTLSRLGPLANQVTSLRHHGQLSMLNTLITTDRDVSALGRFVVTLNPNDIGRFKTPSLRNVALNAPYMHDGSVGTLPEAVEIELYSRSARNYPLVLTEDERAELLAFLQALSSL